MYKQCPVNINPLTNYKTKPTISLFKKKHQKPVIHEKIKKPSIRSKKNITLHFYPKTKIPKPIKSQLPPTFPHFLINQNRPQ
jgi:hypothetical protein